ncbi:unnamed protein product, partial [Iphiclides podalirius]
MLGAKCSAGSDTPNSVLYETTEVQTESDYVSVSTQVNVPCFDCEKRKTTAQNKSLRRYFWEPIKCLFQLFAVLCFVCAICALYGVTRRRALCERQPLPWRWLDPQDLLDFLLRIEYVAEVPM